MTAHRVRHPERWWLATLRDLPWLTDPDVDDGRQRWDDRDQLDWAGVGEAVVAVWSWLASGEADPDEPATVVVPAPWVLPPAEAAVVRSWWAAEAPQGDVWSDELTNGRHRLWNVWRVAPAARLPIRSDTLGYMDDVPGMPQLAASIRDSVATGLKAAAQPLLAGNSRHVAELRRVATPGSRMP